MSDLDVGLLRTFLMLSKTQNFTKTASLVHKSQAAVSMQLSKLESLLQKKLFIRNKRTVSITDDGERLLAYAEKIIGLSDELLHRFDKDDINGEVRFGSPEDFATYYLPDILSSFVKSHPKILLNVNCDLTLKLIKGFEANEYDVIVTKQEPKNVYQSSIPLWREDIVWAGGKGFRANSKFTASAKPIKLVLSPAPCVYRQRAIDSLNSLGVPWKIAYSSPSFSGVVAAVRAGLGVTVLPIKMIPPDLKILEHSYGWPKLQETLICLLVSDNASAAVSEFASFIHDKISINNKKL